MINVTFPDKSIRSYQVGITPIEIANSISSSLAKKVLVAIVNEIEWDLNRAITTDCSINLCTWADAQGKKTFWHSSAHLLAEALKSFYPNIHFGIGPPIENGFYYDIDLQGAKFSNEDFKKIEEKMLELASLNNDYIRYEVSKKDAEDFFNKNYDPYKLELLRGLNDGEITFYKQGSFTDLCKGAHLPSTKYIKSAKLLNIAGAYWRGDISKKQLTRVYAITFPNKSELDEYLFNLEEAKKRNHQKLGRDLKIFTFSDQVGSGLPLWLPNGAIIRQRLMDFIYQDQIKNGYSPVVTPHIAKKELYVTSGHYHKYGEDSFQPIKTPNENEEYFLKPMNCPHHCEIYKFEPHSYKELPIRLCEFGTVYRYEQHGELHGLSRTRCLTQDDAHIFCTKEQVRDEFDSIIKRVIKTFKALSFDKYVARISLRDPNNSEKYIGDPADWDDAESVIRQVVASNNMTSFEGLGEAAFYGPKLDFLVQDALGRKWQLGTIQLDYQLPKRFELEYIGADNKKHTPIMIHRAPLGSFERLMSILLEHTAGNLPLWLAPIQVSIVTISDKFESYAAEISAKLANNNLFVHLDNRSENLNKKILDAETKKIPYVIVIGEQEQLQKNISVRKHGKQNLGNMDINKFIEFLQTEINSSIY